MKGALFLVGLCFLLSCEPDDPVNDCSLDKYDSKKYKGFIRLCNALPGQQQDFEGTALMIANDSILTFQIESTDTSANFYYSVSVISECVLAEDEFRHLLHDTLNNNIIGDIGLGGTSLFLKLVTNPCPDNGTFSGIIK